MLAPHVRVQVAVEDPTLTQVELLDEEGPVRRLLLIPVASGEPRLIRSLLPQLRELGMSRATLPVMLVPHMGSAGGRLCREAGIGFLDCCANASLRFNNVFVQITGNRNRFLTRKKIRTLFRDKATIPLRVMLADPQRWLTTREIAHKGNLSLGWVSHVLQQMESDGYVERKRGGGSRPLNPKRLLQDWLQEYAFELNEIYPFQLCDGDLEDSLQRLRVLQAPHVDRYALTLDAAMHALRQPSPQRSLPFDLHIYLPDLAADLEGTLDTWRRVLRLRPAGVDANCCLVKPAYRNAACFGAQASHGLRTVSDLQLYLDVYSYPSAGRQQAHINVAPRLPFSVQ